MSGFLTDTLVWTGALLALVLMVRRPVAQVFGARAAYALWVLPMGRLLLPPLVLPAWIAPAPQEPVPFLSVSVDFEPVADGAIAAAPVEVVAAAPVAEWSTVLFVIWLAGAALFLTRRYALYFRMRREFLVQARPVGEAGSIRLVETPLAEGPVAFGVIDKVIALPPGFMASRDIAARDLALAHELAHHRGRDLLCNMLVQPLFAIHWFNPLAILGWNALRRDQEAACDARVVADAPREERAAYAAVIARFATRTGAPSRLALAAPMACPVLGDRSIVHRLRTLAMNRISRRRRWTGRLLVGAGVLALPLTASISYAQEEVPPAPPAPVAPLPPEAPAQPAAAEAPLPPEAPREERHEWTSKDGKHRFVRIERLEKGRSVDGDEPVRVKNVRIIRDGKEISADDRAEFAREMAETREELRRELGEGSEFQREMRRLDPEISRETGEKAERHRRLALAESGPYAPRVIVRCRDGQDGVTENVTGKDGREELWVCRSAATAEARRALAEARAEIARTRDISAKARADALQAIATAEKSLRAD